MRPGEAPGEAKTPIAIPTVVLGGIVTETFDKTGSATVLLPTPMVELKVCVAANVHPLATDTATPGAPLMGVGRVHKVASDSPVALITVETSVMIIGYEFAFWRLNVTKPLPLLATNVGCVDITVLCALAYKTITVIIMVNSVLTEIMLWKNVLINTLLPTLLGFRL